MTLTQALETAKSKTQNEKWIRSAEKAAAKLTNGELIVTLLADGALISSANGTYKTTRKSCTCPAKVEYCYHKSALALCEMMEGTAVPSPVDEKAEVIDQLRAAWSKKYANNRRYDLAHTVYSISGASSIENAPIERLRALLGAF
jgi:hypothetical protein